MDKFRSRDHVRISKHKNVFAKAYQGRMQGAATAANAASRNGSH